MRCCCGSCEGSGDLLSPCRRTRRCCGRPCPSARGFRQLPYDVREGRSVHPLAREPAASVVLFPCGVGAAPERVLLRRDEIDCHRAAISRCGVQHPVHVHDDGRVCVAFAAVALEGGRKPPVPRGEQGVCRGEVHFDGGDAAVGMRGHVVRYEPDHRRVPFVVPL